MTATSLELWWSASNTCLSQVRSHFMESYAHHALLLRLPNDERFDLPHSTGRIDSVGLFRIEAKADEVARLKAAYDQGTDIDGMYNRRCSVSHVLCAFQTKRQSSTALRGLRVRDVWTQYMFGA